MKSIPGALIASLLLAGCLATHQTKNDSASAQPTAKAEPAAGSGIAQAATSDVPCRSDAAPAAPAKPAKGKAKPAAKPAPASTAAAPCQPAAAPAAPEKSSAPAAAASGNRREVKGINDWSGYIEGVPAAGSRFNKLQIGMGLKQVTDLIGAPTDQQSHVTGKAWIPFYYGSGTHETHLYYKGVGRLVFAGGAGFSSSLNLIGIEHDSNEGGYGR